MSWKTTKDEGAIIIMMMMIMKANEQKLVYAALT